MVNHNRKLPVTTKMNLNIAVVKAVLTTNGKNRELTNI